MKLTTASVLAAALVAGGAYAEEEEEVAEAPAAEEAAKPTTESARTFFTLPVCRRIQGQAEFLLPNTGTWAPAEEGRFYPLGTSFRAAAGGQIVVSFGPSASVTVANGSSFATKAQGLGVVSRTIVLTGGEVSLSLPGSLNPGMFFVTMPSLTVSNPAGDSVYLYEDKGDGYDATVRCVTGSLEVKGRHFTIPAMHAADAFRVRSSHDDLETVLYGKSGDYVARLDRGIVTRPEIQDDGTTKDVVAPESLDWHLSVATRVQINRAVPALGERLSVTMMTFDSAGTMKNHFAFAEGRSEVNTGELVHTPADAEAAMRSAAAATTEAAAEAEEESSSSSEEEADSSADADDE